MPCVGIDSGQFYREELKSDQFDLFQIEFSLLSCCSIDRRERLGLKPLRITLIRITRVDLWRCGYPLATHTLVLGPYR
jgi:hypothetical protein